MLPPRNDCLLWDALQDPNASAGPAGDPHGEGPGPEAVAVPLLFGLIFVLGVLGNLLVVGVILGLGRRGAAHPPGPTNVFLLNLSAADLGFLLVCVPPQATVYSLPHWVFGGFLCSFGHFFTSACMLVSIFTLVAMSADRYLAVVRARSALCVRSRRNALAGVLLIWGASLACSGPVARHQVLLTGHPSAPNSTFCWEDWSGAGQGRRAYKVLVLVLGFLLPLLLICWCYSRVLCHLHKKMMTKSKKSKRSKKKTTQTVLLVVAAFTICWMPHHIIAMWVEFGTFPLNDATFAFRIISHCLSYGNSCVNPILYAFMSENFRKACRQVLGRHFLSSMPPHGTVVRFRLDNFSTTHSTTNV
ncbi:galanin receptor type 1b [Cololabis saira]|uniref:galanin receptor type 1b n=1 Tax=Cololabis saira TaxID=129043 RepID=UPI002AD2A2AE|nr:galanin receptor type 1b [Cololabis saira]